MTRSQYGLIIVGISIICLVCIFIGKAIGTTKTLIVTKMPENPICQPFRDATSQEAQDYYIKKIGARPIMHQELFKAHEAEKRGEGQVISFSNYTCAEHLGSIQSARATTYYFANKR